MKVGYLALLWVFVLVVAAAMRRDLMPRRRRTSSGRTAAPTAPPVAAPVAGTAGAKPGKASKPKRGQPRTLSVTAGTLKGTTLDLTDAPISLGRAADNTLVLDDDYASGHHARLRPYDGGWLVEDLGSTNGTFLDKAKVTAPTPVPVGVPVRIGKTALELRK
ncbi:MAG TPA: FHA domain-containing protein [Candidatus Limnocylindria bacterium]|nr:FHA domain-containing protein [Candidatus Limnocylindria bacterium]